MKILFVTPPPSLPNKLHRTRAYEFIKILAKKNNIHLLCVTTDKKETVEFDEIKKICKTTTIRFSKFKALLNCLRFPFLPLEVSYCYSKKTRQKIIQIIKKEKIDIIYLKRLRSAVYLPKANVPVIMDTTDAMSMFYLRMAQNHSFPKKIFYYMEMIKYRRYEKETMKKIKNWTVCSEIDKKHLLKNCHSVKITVIPNPISIPNHQSLITNHSLLFRGLMDKPVNVDAIVFFVKKIFPLIEKEIKDIKLLIVGPNPVSKVKRLAKDNIIVTGFVKDDKEYFNKCSVLVCPIRIGSGIRNKILQSWAFKKPVISTTIGAEGLIYKNGENIIIADNPKQFAKKTVEVLKNKKLYNKLVENGYKTVKEYYSHKMVERELDRVIKHYETN